MRLILVNPNTTEHITQRLFISAQKVLPAGSSLTAVTATQGPKAVRSAADVPAATDNMLRMVDEHATGYDAVLLGISLDCGLWELRQRYVHQPFIGMTEAACLMACLHGRRFGVLTLGPHMAPLYVEHIAQLGLSQRLVGVVAPEAPQAFDALPDQFSPEILDLLTLAARTSLEQGAQSIVLAGAVLTGYGHRLEQRLTCPILDGMASAVLLAGASLLRRKS